MKKLFLVAFIVLLLSGCNGLFAPDRTRVACGENPVVYVQPDENVAQLEQFYHTVYSFWERVPDAQARPQLLVFPSTGFLDRGTPIDLIHGSIQYRDYAFLSVYGSRVWTHRTEICPR